MNLIKICEILHTCGRQHKVESAVFKVDNAQVDQGEIAVITSKQAFFNYDKIHPERILCILYDGSCTLVIAKNRENDVQATIKRWLNNPDPLKDPYCAGTLECAICYKNITRRNVLFTFCTQCHYPMCKKCFEKISPDAASFKCPQCRTWNLISEEFGIPWKDGTFMKHVQPNDPFEMLDGVLRKLDGFVEVLPVIDRRMCESLSMLRLSYTTRHIKRSYLHSRGTIKKRLKQLYSDNKDESNIIRFYIYRRTYAIDKIACKPIVEVSLFQFFRGQLVQVSTEVWCPISDLDNATHKCIEYIPPFTFDIPAIFQRLHDHISEQFTQCDKLVGICTKTACDFVLQIDKSGCMDTPQQVLAFHLATIFESGQDLYITIRLFYEDEYEVAQFVCYMIANNTYAQLEPKVSRKLWNKNIDNLKKTAKITRFL